MAGLAKTAGLTSFFPVPLLTVRVIKKKKTTAAGSFLHLTRILTNQNFY